MKIKLLAAMSACALLAAQAQAVTVNVGYDNGTTNSTTALTGFATNGAMMDGMVVTAYFGAVSETLIWASAGTTSGAIFGTGWALIEVGDTFSSVWSLVNERAASMTRLEIDAGPGNTVFDTTAIGDVNGTLDSARGSSFHVSFISDVDAGDVITATYRDAVGLGASAPVGDLFRRLDITFSDGLSRNSIMTYITDTDNLRFAGDITPVAGVPDTMSTLSGLGIALVGLLGAARRRQYC